MPKKLSSKTILLICAVLVIYCPFFYMNHIYHYVEDTMIQIKTGMDCFTYHTFIPLERYSWHEGLNWIKHEVGWYYLVGIAYKLLGVIGVIGVAAIINYTIAGLAFKFNSKKVHPLIIIITACAARFLSFPNYNARPNLFSQLALTVLLITMFSNKSNKVKGITFVVVAFCASWFHGGMMPIMFAVFVVFTVMEFLFKNYKTGVYYLCALGAGFVASLLNPIGIDAWIYPIKMTGEGSKYIWSFNQEWTPKVFTMVEMVIILLIFIGFAVDDRLRKFDKNTILRLCFLCMFIILSCKHCRFMNYVALVVLILGAEEVQALINWLNSNLFHINKDIFDFTDMSNYIIAAFCAGFAIFTTFTSWTTYFPTNTMSDISSLAAYDEGVVDVIKDKGYETIFNNFDTGTWLAFYDVKVHIDNRVDLYLPQYSGQDYFEGHLVLENIDQADAFYDKYSPDAFVIESFPNTTDEAVINDMIESGRYKLVYDNYCTSSYDPNITLRWSVFECVYD